MTFYKFTHMPLLKNDAQLKKENNQLGKKKKQSPKFIKKEKSCPERKNHIYLNSRKKKKKKSKRPYCTDQTKKKINERVQSYIMPRRKKNNKETIGTREGVVVLSFDYNYISTPHSPIFSPNWRDSILVGSRRKHPNSTNLPFSLLTNQTPTKSIFSLLFSLPFSIIFKISQTT